MSSAIIIGFWAFLFTGPLQKEREVFWWLRKLLWKLDPLVRKGERQAPDEDRILGIYWWLWKWGVCAKCHACIMALIWVAVHLLFRDYDLTEKLKVGFQFVAIAVFTAYVAAEKLK